jgi:hypothetical protein
MASEFATHMQYVQRVCDPALSHKGASPAEMSSSGFPMQKSFFNDIGCSCFGSLVLESLEKFIFLEGPKPLYFDSILFFFQVGTADRKMSMNTTLHAAARDGNMELVRDIVEGINGQAKVSINTQNSTGQTAMHLAAKWGRLEVVKYLIEAGADLEIRDRRGRTPIHDADDAIVQVRDSVLVFFSASFLYC